MYLKPAEYVIYIFDNNASSVAKAIGKTRAAVSKWLKPEEKGGCNGYVPRQAQQLILEKAQELKLDIEAIDLILGREVE